MEPDSQLHSSIKNIPKMGLRAAAIANLGRSKGENYEKERFYIS
jgi:hypothetical protein